MKQLKHANYDEQSKILSSPFAPAQFREEDLSLFTLKLFAQHRTKNYLTEAGSNKSMRFEDVQVMSREIASAIINELGLKVGDVIFGYSPNSAIYVCLIYASLFAGTTFTGCYWTLNKSLLAEQVTDSKAKVIFCVGKNVDTVFQSLAECPSVHTVVLLDSHLARDMNNNCPSVKFKTLAQLMATCTPNDRKIPRKTGLDVRSHIPFLCYSSGSTGPRKGAQKSAYSYLAACHNIGDSRLFFGRPGDTVSCFQHVAHASGIQTLILAAFNGCHVILLDSLTPEKLCRAIEEHKVTVSLIPPNDLKCLVKFDSSQFDLSALKFVTTAGARLRVEQVGPFLSKFQSMEKLYNAYGITEGGIVASTPEDCDNILAVGAPVRGAQVKIIDQETGQKLSFGQRGHIYIRSEQMANGYLNKPNDGTFTSLGWCKTGDIGYFDHDGLVYIEDRAKEMIKVGTWQVIPSRLEDILLEHPAVEQAVVVATDDETTGETPRAFVVPKDPSYLPKERELLDLVNKQVNFYEKIEGGVFLVKQLPKLLSLAKVDRQMLKKDPGRLIFLNPFNKLN